MKRLLVILMLVLWAGTAQALWVSPTGFSDPGGKWSNATNAYDINAASYSSSSNNTEGYYLYLTHDGVTDCNQVKLYFSAASGKTVVIDVNCNGEWVNVYTGLNTTLAWRVYDLGTAYTVTGFRISSWGTGITNSKIYEAFFWTPSIAEPTAVTNVSPANEATNQKWKTNLSWTLGDYRDTLFYKVYLGTATGVYDILNGVPVNMYSFVSTNPSTEVYYPGGVPPGDTYYWKVDAVNDYGTTVGTEWSFTTIASQKQYLFE